MNRMKRGKTILCVLKIPDHLGARPVPAARQAEIDSAGAQTVRLEKYWTFRLFTELSRFALGEIPDAKRSECGRWEADGIFLSFSHSGGYAAVALSGDPVGADIQSTEANVSERLIRRALTEGERRKVDALPEEDRARGFLRIFSEKESVFKTKGEAVFRPERIDTEAESATRVEDFGIADMIVTLSPKPEELTLCRAEAEGDKILFEIISKKEGNEI